MSEEALQAVQKLVEAEEKRRVFARVPMPRDYVYCPWCNAKGCAACFNARQQRKKELDEEYARQFPDGPKPIFTVDITTPEGVAAARRVVGREAIEKAFGPGGGGVDEIIANAEKEKGAKKE